MLAWLAEDEVKRLKERTRAGIARARAEGKQIGRAPYDISREVVEDMRNSGMRWRDIARHLRCDDMTLRRRRLTWKELDLGRNNG